MVEGEAMVADHAVRVGRRWTVALTALSAMLMTLDITIVNVALPDIATDLRTGLDSLQWIVNAYTLAFAALLLSVGSLSDRMGRRLLFGTGVAVFTLASLACAVAPTAPLLIVARAVQGLGGAFVMGTALALIAAAYDGAPARARTTAIGLFSAGGGAAAALGPLIGGLVVDGWGWRFIFVINLPIGLVILAGTWLRIRESVVRDRGHRLDLAGLVLGALVLFALNYALLTGPHDGWGSVTVVVALAGGVVLFAVFLVVQHRRGPAAMLDLGLFRIRSFTGAILVTYAARVFSFGLLPFLILWLGGMLGYGPLQIGVRLLLLSAAMIVVAPLSGALTRFVPTGVILATGMAITGVGVLSMTTIGPDDTWTAGALGMVLIGVGGGLVAPHLLGVAVGVVPAERAGMASGAANTFFPLGTASGVAVFGALLSRRIDSGLADGRLAEFGIPASTADDLRALVAAGRFDQLAASVPAPAREPVLAAARAAYTDGLSTIFVVAGVAGLLAAVAALVLISDKDLHHPDTPTD